MISGFNTNTAGGGATAFNTTSPDASALITPKLAAMLHALTYGPGGYDQDMRDNFDMDNAPTAYTGGQRSRSGMAGLLTGGYGDYVPIEPEPVPEENAHPNTKPGLVTAPPATAPAPATPAPAPSSAPAPVDDGLAAYFAGIHPSENSGVRTGVAPGTAGVTMSSFGYQPPNSGVNAFYRGLAGY